jgi:hypothetical protein
MTRRVSRDVVWLAAISGLFALLCINVVVGVTKGFDRAGSNPLVVLLASPGIAFGWGGVALVLLAVPYALLTWRQGKGPGSVLAVLGALVSAFAVGALAGVFATTHGGGGGLAAGRLAALLEGALGTALAAVLLLLVAAPGLLLALAPLILQSGTARAALRATTTGAVKPRYPQPRIGPNGEELPPEFTGSADVGPIRFRDDADRMPIEPPVSTVTLSPPPAVGPAAKRSRPIVGVRFADEPVDAPSEAPAAEPHPVAAHPRQEDRLPKGVRFADAPLEPAAPMTAPSDEFAGAGLVEPRAPDAVAPPAEPAPTVEPGDAVPGVSSPADAPPEAAAAAEAPAPPKKPKRGESYRRKLSETGLLDRGPAAAPSGETAAPGERQSRPKDVRDAIRGLFSTLPLDDLPPPGEEAASIEPEPPPAVAPGQSALFDPAGSRGRHPASADPLFAQSVEAAIERGAGSLVLLKRKLGIGYARAAALMEALVEEGIVGEMTASGSRPTLVTAEEWQRRNRTGKR